MSRVEEFLSRLDRVTQEGDSWRAQCPACGGSDPRKLIVRIADNGKILLHCFGGCSFSEIGRAVEIPKSEKADDEQCLRAQREKRERELKAQTEVLSLWKQLSEPGAHPYLNKKQINSHGARVQGRSLVVPVYVSGEMTSLQFIRPDSSKRFYPGGKVKGGYFSIGKVGRTICLAEGFATAASIYESTGLGVAISFSAGNMKPVAEYLKSKYPNASILPCADNDATEVGEREAKRITEWVALPPEQGDWNDIAVKYGKHVVREKIMGMIEQ